MSKSSNFYSPWTQKKKLILGAISTIVFFVLAFLVVIWVINSRTPQEPSNPSELVYETRYYNQFGSRGVRIYNGGEVFEDIESENPNHKPNYKYVKTLTSEQMTDLTTKKASGEMTDDEFMKYVKKVVYGD